MNCTSRRAYISECTFLYSLINSVSSVISLCNRANPLPTKKILTQGGLEYKTTAANTEVVTLTIEGFIEYLYYKAYNTIWPEKPTLADMNRLYEIYDALKIPRPV